MARYLAVTSSGLYGSFSEESAVLGWLRDVRKVPGVVLAETEHGELVAIATLCGDGTVVCHGAVDCAGRYVFVE
jgi:hypothetical protein